MIFYNTLHHGYEEFCPIQEGKVAIYGCGPTVYNYAHIGNLRSYVFLDTLRRTFSYLGYDVKLVMNITDIGHLTGDGDEGEDKMVKSAREKHKSVLEVARFYEDAFFSDCAKLNIARPSVVCRASEHIEEMISLISRLERRGHTYISGGNVYFDVSTFPSYCDFARLQQQQEGQTRVGIDKNKHNARDFVLWFTKSKFENHALKWSSPWGEGYPGWHVECSAMSMKYLGEHFDIHTGGIDHVSVHHTNEIAQNEAAVGHRVVNYWLHNEFLVMAGGDEKKEKMSKSGGNFLTLSDLLSRGFDAADYRYFLLSMHYRSEAAFSFRALEGAKASRTALKNRVLHFAAAKSASLGEDALKYDNLFKSALSDDLSTPKALAVFNQMLRDSSLSEGEKRALSEKFDSVFALSLFQEEKKAVDEEEIEAKIRERAKLKAAKDYEAADKIREELKESGIILLDSKDKTTWRKV